MVNIFCDVFAKLPINILLSNLKKEFFVSIHDQAGKHPFLVLGYILFEKPFSFDGNFLFVIKG